MAKIPRKKLAEACALLETGATIEIVSMVTGLGVERIMNCMKAAELDGDGKYDGPRAPVRDGVKMRAAMGRYAANALSRVEGYDRTPRYALAWLQELKSSGHWVVDDRAALPAQWSAYERSVIDGRGTDDD